MNLIPRVRFMPGLTDPENGEQAFQPGQHSLEAVLDQLSLHGTPRLHQFKDKCWSCCLDMHVSGEGISFEIKSDFTHSSPLDAALCCQDRMNSALKGFGK